MQRKNNLSETLRRLQRERGMTQCEFAQALDIPPSTLQSVAPRGEASADTLIRIANAAGPTLDELVFGAPPPSARDSAVRCLEALGFYSRLPKNRQQLLKQHVLSILELLEEN